MSWHRGHPISALLIPALVAGLQACAPYVSYRGTVLFGTPRGYTFDDVENPSHLSPVQGAIVTLYELDAKPALFDCGASRASDARFERSLPPSLLSHPRDITRTDAAGHFEVFHRLSSREAPTILCVEDARGGFLFQTVHGDPKAPTHGEKIMNIVFPRPQFRCVCDPKTDECYC